jgi:hypothetical protein
MSRSAHCDVSSVLMTVYSEYKTFLRVHDHPLVTCVS